MKKIALLLSVVLSTHCMGRGIVSVKVSRAVCLLTFLQAANDDPELSPTLRAYIRDHIPTADSAKFAGIVHDFASLPLDFSYVIPGYPDSRLWPRRTLNLISIAAVQATDTRDLMQRIIGILPNEDWLKLGQVMDAAAPFYDKMIGKPFDAATNKQLAALSQFTPKADDIFAHLKVFYGSTWTSDIPFTISMYPIPGTKGSSASPHSNSIMLGMLTEDKDPQMNLCIAIHEMCHMLYLEQSLALQKKIDGWFAGNSSVYSKYAYSYFDEALATASANGWAYKEMSGKMDKRHWYADDYIDGYGHAIYPMVTRYIAIGREIDKAFVDSAIELFGQRFPKAMYQYQNLFNNVSIYTDATDHAQCISIVNAVEQHFTMHNTGSTYPIADEQTLSRMDNAAGSQLFIVHTAHEENFKVLRTKFPQLKDISSGSEGITSFIDDRKRAIIIVNVKNLSRLEKAVNALAASKEINPDKMFTAAGW